MTVETEGGVKIGLFGLTVAGFPFDGFVTTGTVDGAREAVDILKQEGCSVIAGIGHTGWNDDLVTPSANDVTSAEAVKEVPGIDVYIDGHSHSVINGGSGWICPLGLVQELLHKIPTPIIRKSRLTRMLSWLKYVFLAGFVIAVPLIYGVGKGLVLPGFCKYICPAGTLEGAVSLLQHPANATSFYQLGAIFTSKWVIMLVIGLACIFCYRTFCRFICPLGAIYGFFNRFALTGVKVEPERCNNCGLCVMKCPMDVKHVGDHECISCGKCIDTCAQGAIFLSCGKITLKSSETGKNADPEPVIRKRKKAGRIVWGIALAVLVFAVAWFSWIAPAGTGTETPAASGDRTVGTEVGNLLPDFSMELLCGEDFHLSDYRGRVVILNFWATTCAPCVEELPYYEQLKVAYPDVEILAIHHKAGAKKAADFLADKGWDHLDFALDSKEKGIMDLLNAADAMPQTIILDRQGIVTYNAQTPLTFEKLEILYKEALGNNSP